MTVAAIKGLEALRRRFAAAGASAPVKGALRAEAETIAEAARREAPGQLGGTVEVIDQSRGTRSAYAIGTAHPAGTWLEYGTVRRPATPWLWPAFRARSPAVKHHLRRLIGAALQARRYLTEAS